MAAITVIFDISRCIDKRLHDLTMFQILNMVVNVLSNLDTPWSERPSRLPPVVVPPLGGANRGNAQGKYTQEELYRPLFSRRMQAARQKRLEEEKVKNQQTIKIEVTSTVLNGDINSDKCHDYENLLQAKISFEYSHDPVQNLRAQYLNINENSEPGESYYTLVLKVNSAVEQGSLIPIRGTYVRGENGIVTQTYMVVKDGTTLRLVSHLALPQANIYFRRKLESDCHYPLDEGVSLRNQDIRPQIGSNLYSNAEVPDSSKDNRQRISSSLKRPENIGQHRSVGPRDCYRPQKVEELKNKMDEINVDSVPGREYYKLVLEVNTAVACNLLVVIADTLYTGLRGIHTELYRMVTDNILYRLVSDRDRYKAWAYFHTRQSALDRKIIQLDIRPHNNENSNDRYSEINRPEREYPLYRTSYGSQFDRVGTTKRSLLDIFKTPY